jgi:hypothetical protein
MFKCWSVNRLVNGRPSIGYNLFIYLHFRGTYNAIQDFVKYYNHERYHESLQNVTPSDAYYGRQEQNLQKRILIKQQSLKRRKQLFL